MRINFTLPPDFDPNEFQRKIEEAARKAFDDMYRQAFFGGTGEAGIKRLHDALDRKLSAIDADYAAAERGRAQSALTVDGEGE